MEDSTVHFEVSFAVPKAGRRMALAHDPDQAAELARGFTDDGMKDVRVHKVTTTREPYNAG